MDKVDRLADAKSVALKSFESGCSTYETETCFLQLQSRVVLFDSVRRVLEALNFKPIQGTGHQYLT